MYGGGETAFGREYLQQLGACRAGCNLLTLTENVRNLLREVLVCLADVFCLDILAAAPVLRVLKLNLVPDGTLPEHPENGAGFGDAPRDAVLVREVAYSLTSNILLSSRTCWNRATVSRAIRRFHDHSCLVGLVSLHQ